MKHRQDIRTVLCLLVSYFVLWAAVLSQTSLLFLFAFFAGFFILAFLANIICHNAIHHSIFRSNRANDAVFFLISVIQGHPAHKILIPHNLNHHRYFMDERDWMHARLAGKGWGLKRIFVYVYRSFRLPRFEKRNPVLDAIPQATIAKFKLQQLAIRAHFLVFILINWKIALLLILPAQLAAVGSLMALNLLQHDGCDLKSPLNHSRNFTSPFVNWIFFNNGLHTAHHLAPTAHWSELPAIHDEKVHGRVRPDLEEKSLLRFFYRRYVALTIS